MRHETCLVCRTEGRDTGGWQQYALTLAREERDAGTHHHHLIECERCSAWWFVDVTTGPLGLPADNRRDTVACTCDESLLFARTTALVPEPEGQCRCDRASVDRNRPHAARITTDDYYRTRDPKGSRS
jgi:hypothetical protein